MTYSTHQLYHLFLDGPLPNLLFYKEYHVLGTNNPSLSNIKSINI